MRAEHLAEGACPVCGVGEATEYMVARMHTLVMKGHVCLDCFARVAAVRGMEAESVSLQDYRETEECIPDFLLELLEEETGSED